MGFLLGFHEKRFQSSRLTPLNFRAMGSWGSPKFGPSQTLPIRLWTSNFCGHLLQEGLFGHRRCCY